MIDAAFLDDFRQTIDRAAERLLGYSDADASVHLAPGKWSRKEIIGHLIDSASNNHGRFVRARHNLHQLAWKPVPQSEPTRSRISCATTLRT